MKHDLLHIQGKPYVLVPLHEYRKMLDIGVEAGDSALPQDVLDDPQAPHPQQKLFLGQAGSVVVMNAHLWHAGLPNRTSKPRTALHAFYARGDKPQQQYQKQLLSPQLQANLSPQLRQLLALDDPRNDQLSSEVAVRSGFLK